MTSTPQLIDTGERMIPPAKNEVSFVFARLRFAYEFAAQYAKQRFVLDVGCGTGYGCKLLAETAAFVCGIDYDDQALRYCRRHFAAKNIAHAQMNAAALGLHRAFDLAVSFQVIEHVTDAHQFVEQIKRVVKPEGKIIIGTLNVPREKQMEHGNPFHQSEMDYAQFSGLMRAHFSEFEVVGVAYAHRNRTRRFLQRLPFYGWGRRLKRASFIKKTADRVLDLSKFQITRERVENAMDIIAICENA
ncbi:MAG: class I SAM-dependent methyltransferase [candidate division KSB1 bacterium]